MNPHLIYSIDEGKQFAEEATDDLKAEAAKKGETVVKTICRVNGKKGETCDYILTVTPKGKVTKEIVEST